MNQLENFNNQNNKFNATESWTLKKSENFIIEQQHNLDMINEEIKELENSAHSTSFGKFLNSFTGKQSKLTILYQQRRAHEAMLEKLKGGEREH